MSQENGAAPIFFRVRGHALAPSATSRGTGASAAWGTPAAGADGASAFKTVQRVRLAAQRSGNGDTLRLSARPGQDAVVLHISNGPSLMLHPETARDLMLAQAGAAAPQQRSGDPAQAAAGMSPTQDPSGAVDVPSQLQWLGTGSGAGSGSTRAATRGPLGAVLLRDIDIVSGLFSETASEHTARWIAQRVDEQVDAGLYLLSADGLKAPLKGQGRKIDRLPESPGGAPMLVLLHGTFSDTHGTFGALWKEHPQKVRQLFAHYGGRVYAHDHPTLTASPIDNALQLAQALPRGTRLHLLTHSRGGLVAEVLARASAPNAAGTGQSAPFQDPAYQQHSQALRRLIELLQTRNIRVERVVRVACPARGTLLASRRLDAYVSVLKWSLELAGVPVAPRLVEFLGAVASQRTDPKLLPGLEAMTPQSPLLQWLHSQRDPLPGLLHVVAGDVQGDSVVSWVKTLLADAFYWTDNDLVVQTRSMYGGVPRRAVAGRAGASYVLDQGARVSHFAYFSNPRTAQAICNALLQDTPADFQPIGPLSWAGQSSTGVRSGTGVTDGRAASERAAVIVIPDLMASHLAQAGERLWLNPERLGDWSRLAWRGDAPASHGDEGGPTVRPDGAVSSGYAALVAFFSASHEVQVFDFDWRAPIEREARRLAQVLDQALSARDRSGQAVHLLAHGMGGLVARTVALENAAVWQRWLQRRGSRLLMLGTPNEGSLQPMQWLSGDERMGLRLGAWCPPGHMPALRQWLADMPGLMQLQAGLLDAGLGLHDSARWRALALQDQPQQRPSSWHTDPAEHGEALWGLPSQAVLDQAVALQRRLRQQRDTDLKHFADRLLVVQGQAPFTPLGFDASAEQGLAYWGSAAAGDGQVSHASARLPGVKTWQADAEHAGLSRFEPAFEAYRELLSQGQTERLQRQDERNTSDPGGTRLRSRPARENDDSRSTEPPSALEDVFMPAAAPVARPEGKTSTAVRLHVHNGNLRFVGGTLLVGHYSASKLSGSESVVDRNMGGLLAASLSLGLYPDAPGSHQSFSNARQHPDNALALPRPQHVMVVGLGQEGQLRSTELVLTVRQAVMAWAQRVAETPALDHNTFELTAALVGSGGIGVSVGASAQALAQGVREANDRLLPAGWPTVAVLHLIELYLDRATEAWKALQWLAQTAPQQYQLHAHIHSGLGALARPLDVGYRGTGHDFISAIVEKNDNGQPSITYTLDTQRARSEASLQATQTRLVSELVRRASNDANRDQDIGRTLFQLLIPQELETRLRGSSELLIELNEGSAGIPWELLDEPNDGHNGTRQPWALRNRLLRKLRTAQFRPQVRDARAEDAVLVIGEPACEQRLYPPLPAARREALAVAQTFLGANGLSPDRVFTLVGEPNGPGADATTVLNALLARPYRVVHIAGHGEPELAEKGLPTQPRGVVLSDNTYLGPQEVQAMRVVPELVFLNCCYLAADNRNLLKGYDRAAFAGNVAQQLIRMGVRCVVAAGWAIEDEAAQRFASTFYQSLLQGQRFMDAVHQARLAAWEVSPQGNTWAAFQCYGDPEWVWNPDVRDPERAVLALDVEYASIASPAALVLALQTLVVESDTQGANAARQREKIHHLQARFEADWGGLGQVAEAFGAAWAAVGQVEQAMDSYRRALSAEDASATVQCSEQLADLQGRWAWQRVTEAQQTEPPDRAPTLPQALAEGRQLLTQAIQTLQALRSLGATVARETLLGSAYRRLHLLERVARSTTTAAPATATAAADTATSPTGNPANGTSPATPADPARAQADDPAAQALACMLQHHRQAEALARASGSSESFYAALNRFGAELLWQHQRGEAGGLDPQALRALRHALEERCRHAPDFWSVVSLPELASLQALSEGQLAQTLPNILAAYESIHQTVGSASLWASVADHAAFVLHAKLHEASAEGLACQQLLNQLQTWARADKA